jgi:histidinol dehydrogenase
MITIKESKISKGREEESSAEKLVRDIISKVRRDGDKALREFTLKFDKTNISSFKVSEQEIKNAGKKLDKNFIKALKKARERIERFHRIQKERFGDWQKEKDGILTGELFKPLQTVGVYVPAGKAPLPSSLLMGAIPAQVAGVERIVIATPPCRTNFGLPPTKWQAGRQAQKNGKVESHILAAANILGLKEIYKVGGAQAIAALAYGTKSIPKVDKIVGPGNLYVTLAKKLLYGEVGIDILAGPSEVTIIADNTAKPRFIAYDLLSQTEHGLHSPAILICTSPKMCRDVEREIEAILSSCDNITKKSWENNGGLYLAKDLKEAFERSNKIAPEHLILAIKNPRSHLNKVKNAGAVFLGNYSPVTLGDYIAGANHVLPTSQTGRWESPLGVKDFLKSINIISSGKASLKKLQPFLKSLSKAEKLDNHFKAVEIRSEK